MPMPTAIRSSMVIHSDFDPLQPVKSELLGHTLGRET